jgi:hypothetical protein
VYSAFLDDGWKAMNIGMEWHDVLNWLLLIALRTDVYDGDVGLMGVLGLVK